MSQNTFALEVQFSLLSKKLIAVPEGSVPLSFTAYFAMIPMYIFLSRNEKNASTNFTGR